MTPKQERNRVNAMADVRAAVIEKLEDGVMAVDSRGMILDVNPSAEKILGQPAGTLVGQRVTHVLTEWPALLELLSDRGSDHAEATFEDPLGGRFLEVRGSWFRDGEDHLCGGFIVLRDVTERVETERELHEARIAAETANETKSEFMSVASHEMRTPITCIKGYTDLLVKGTAGPINDAQREFLEIVRTNVDRIASLVSDLSDIARIETGHLRLDSGEVSVGGVVQGVVEEMGSQISKKNQALTIDIPDTLPAVWADRGRLGQVLRNLVDNALKFTPSDGHIRVGAAFLGGEPEKTEEVHVWVEDNGIGIRAEEQDRVFQKFYRSDDRAVDDVPGSGLGLSIAKNLVEMQGGRIWLDSTFRKGTTVHITLPSVASS